jgi:phospholipid/cholesterol/gamma-HCH transport system ATP-binding protein
MTDATPDNLVEIRNLVFSRGERRIFDGVDINIARGKVTAIMGPLRLWQDHAVALYWRSVAPGGG